MNRFDAFVRRHPFLFSIAVVIAFLAILIGPDALLDGKSDYVIEAIGSLQRVVITLLAIATLRALGWIDDAFVRNPGSRMSWAIVAGPFVYLAILFPYFFTHSWAPNMRDPGLTALVGLDAFLSGLVEEFVFRALIFMAFLHAWGNSRRSVIKAGIMSAFLFSVPHLTNMLFGQQPLRVFAQVGWAFVLGIAVAWFYYAGRSIWPVVALHGGLDLIVATNRMGMKIAMTPQKGLIMIAVTLPVLIYAWFVLRRP